MKKIKIENHIWLLLLLSISHLSGCEVFKIPLNSIVYQPGKKAEYSKEDLLQRNIESLGLTTSDGERIYSILLKNRESDSLVIYLHGNGGTIHGRIGMLEKIRKMGHSVIGVSYRGYLLSTGSPSQEGLFEDAETVYRFVTENRGYKPEQVIVFGRSLGSAIAIDLVSKRETKGLIAVSPFTSGKELFDAKGASSFIKKKDLSKVDTLYQNQTKTHRISVPTLVIHGTEDKVVPFELGMRLFDTFVADDKNIFVPVEGAGHNDMGYSSKEIDELYWKSIDTFLKSI